MNTILELDQSLFHFINQDLANGVLDAIMPWWRDKKTWIPLYLIMIAFSVIKYRWKGFFFVLAVILAAGLGDIVSSHLMKPTFERARPCNDSTLAEQVRLLVGCGKAYSFTSSHATNHFAVGTVIALTMGLLFPWLRWVAYGWAATIAFGQVYVGVHYPTDVIVGGLIGWIIGNIVAKIYLRFPNLSIATTRKNPDPVP